MSPWPVRDCLNYFGGCDPSRSESLVREIAALFGYGPDYVAFWAVGMFVLPQMFLFWVGTVPESWTGVAKRIGIAVGLLAAVGWVPHFLFWLGGNIFILTLGVLGVISVIGVLAGAYQTVTGARKLYQNLRGG